MPAVSQAMQMASAIAEHNPDALYQKNRGLLSMTRSQLHDFAATPRKGLPPGKGLPRKKKSKARQRYGGPPLEE